MKIFYICDNEGPALMDLDELIGNFRDSGTFVDEDNPVSEADLRAELDGRGWYRSIHQNGEFLVLNIDKLKLTLTSEGWDDPQIYPQGNKR